MPRPARPDARDALLEAAREEFSRRGLARARVEDVARRAGVSKGAFYLHFPSKEDAFGEIVQRFFGALEDHVVRRREVEERLARDAALDLPGRIEAECALDVDLLEVLWRNRQIVAAIEGTTGERYRGLLAGFRRRMVARIAGRIADRQAAGELRADVDPSVFAEIVVGAYEGFSRRMIDLKEKPDLVTWTRSLLSVLYRGIMAEPAARPARRGAAAHDDPRVTRPGARR
jgi:AcrR family transcriptional regulator